MSAIQSDFEKLARDFQRTLAVDELLTSGAAYDGRISLLLLDLRDLKLKMYQESHHNPHLHIDFGGKNNHVASFQISPASCLEGAVRNRRQAKVIVRWIETNTVKLLQIWSELQQGNDAKAKELVVELSGNL